MKFSKEVVVYGSGVSGLVASYYFLKEGFRVYNVDPYKEPKIQTLIEDEGLVELAANSILMNEPVRKMLNDIELDYIHYSEAGKKKYFFRKAKLSRWPIGLLDSLKLAPFILKLKFSKDKLRPKPFETLKSWASRVLPEKFYDRIFKRGLQGVYGPNVDDLSASLVINAFLDFKEKSLGSVSFENGMGEFPKKLKTYLEARGVQFNNDEPKNFSGVRVSSTPAHSLPEFISEKQKNILERVSYHNISIITMFFDESNKMPFSGFGVVFEDEPGVLGLILNSELFPNRAKKGLISETWILDANLLKSEEVSKKAILALRQKMSGEKACKLVKCNYKNWPMAFPIYDVELESVLKNMTKESGIHYFSNWTGAIGLGKMIAKGEDFVKKVIEESCSE